MNPVAAAILAQLQQVVRMRELRSGDRDLDLRVEGVKVYQHARLHRTYADLLASARYAKPARFFLDEVYGPFDFSRRDAQFERVVPLMARILPDEVTRTVHALGELHALSEELDIAAARCIRSLPVGAADYGNAWRQVGRRPDRERQIELLLRVGNAMDVYTAKPLLRRTLRLMRGPARTAGLGELQRFLELGFDTFREMKGARYFLDTIASRERAEMDALFGAGSDATPPTP